MTQRSSAWLDWCLGVACAGMLCLMLAACHDITSLEQESPSRVKAERSGETGERDRCW